MSSRAIVIGIDAYPKLAAEFQLTASTRDAIAFAEWLIAARSFQPCEIALGLGFVAGLELVAPPGTTVFVPIADEVNLQLAALQTAGTLDQLFFFFAGHGAAAANVQFANIDAICCANYSGVLTTNALSVPSIAEVLKGVNANERFLIVDACRDPAIAEAQRVGEAAVTSVPSRHKPGLYVLKATALGDTARAIRMTGGVMTTAFLDAVAKRLGPAKQWDAARAEYVVRWEKLKEVVGMRIALIAPGQEAFSNDDAPSVSNPEILRFPDAAIAPVNLIVSIVPAPEPSMTLTVLRDGGPPFPVNHPVTGPLSLPQSNYSIAVQGGSPVMPPFVNAFPVFDGGAPPTVVFTVSGEAPSPPAALPSVFESVESRGLGGLLGAAAGAVASEGTLTVSVGGAPIAVDDPLMSVAIANANGESITWNPETSLEHVLEGTYNVSVRSASGAVSEGQVFVGPDGATVDLDQPFNASAPMTEALRTMRPDSPGLLMPSERLGPLSDLTLSALGATAVAEAVMNYGGAARALRLGEQWADTELEGVHLLVADGTHNQAREERMRVWQMHEAAPGRYARTRQPDSALKYWEAGVIATVDGYWVELADSDRKRRAGFKAATTVMPNCVALLIVARDPAPASMGDAQGRNSLFQFSIDRAADVAEMLGGIVYGEALQRGRLDGRPLRDDPALRTLMTGKWYEAFSAAIACFAYYAGGSTFDGEFRDLVARIGARSPQLPDLAVANGLRAELDGDTAEAAAHYRGALDRFDLPICSAGSRYLHDAARRLMIQGKGRRYLDEKLGQMVTHPLWTLRREDDVKRAGKPTVGVNFA
jgi:Caspase domain